MSGEETEGIVACCVDREEDENKDNPFVSNGVLCQKADYIIRHSIISRTELRIVDPDVDPGHDSDVNGNATLVSDVISASFATDVQSLAKSAMATNGNHDNVSNGTSHAQAISSKKEKKSCCALL